MDCSKLKKLALSILNTENATDMSGIFYVCSSLVDLKVPKNIIINYNIPAKNMFMWAFENTVLEDSKKNIKKQLK